MITSLNELGKTQKNLGIKTFSLFQPNKRGKKHPNLYRMREIIPPWTVGFNVAFGVHLAGRAALSERCSEKRTLGLRCTAAHPPIDFAWSAGWPTTKTSAVPESWVWILIYYLNKIKNHDVYHSPALTTLWISGIVQLWLKTRLSCDIQTQNVWYFLA